MVVGERGYILTLTIWLLVKGCQVFVGERVLSVCWLVKGYCLYVDCVFVGESTIIVCIVYIIWLHGCWRRVMSVHWLAECMFVGKTARVFIVCTLISWLYVCCLYVHWLTVCVSMGAAFVCFSQLSLLTEPGHVHARNHAYATPNQNIQVFKLNISYLLTTECNFDQQQPILIRTCHVFPHLKKRYVYWPTVIRRNTEKENLHWLQIRFIISVNILSWYA